MPANSNIHTKPAQYRVWCVTAPSREVRVYAHSAVQARKEVAASWGLQLQDVGAQYVGEG